jgi:hypothetical protein
MQHNRNNLSLPVRQETIGAANQAGMELFCAFVGKKLASSSGMFGWMHPRSDVSAGVGKGVRRA